jgi:predicted Zn-dependent protease
MVDSLRRITTQETSSIRPKIIDVVTVKPGDTPQLLSRRMAYHDFQLDRFLSLNGLTANSRLAPGQRVKMVIYGARRT